MSSETADIETYIFVKEYISKYELNIDINSKPLKNRMVEVNTIMKFEDKDIDFYKNFLSKFIPSNREFFNTVKSLLPNKHNYYEIIYI